VRDLNSRVGAQRDDGELRAAAVRSFHARAVQRLHERLEMPGGDD
jgi:hypothetical protein